MTINVANIVASVGADLTNFKLGMKDVDARLNQIEARSNRTQSRLASMSAAASKYDDTANRAARERMNAIRSGSQYSRNADNIRARRTDIETGNSKYQARIDELQKRQGELDISPLIRQARAADAELSAALRHQQQLKADFNSNLTKATRTAIDETVGTATKELEHQVAAFNAAQLKLREAEAKLQTSKSAPNTNAITAAERELQTALQRHAVADARLSAANQKVHEIQYYDPIKQVGINAATKSLQSAQLAHGGTGQKVADAQAKLAAAQAGTDAKAIAIASKELETATARFATAEVKLKEAQEKVAAATIIGTNKGTAAVNKELENATKAYTEAQEKFRRAQSALETHAATASALNTEEQSVRQAAQREIDNLRRQEAEQRNKHDAYLSTLFAKENAYRGRAADTRSKIDPIREEAEATEEAARSRAALAAQRAKEARNSALDTTGNVMIGTGAAIVGVLGAATKVGADYNQQMVLAAHNTSLTAEGVETMRNAVAKLGLESGADLKELTQGFRLIENFGYNAAQSTDLLKVAMHGAVATGADLSVTSELLAKAIKEFNLPVDQAGKVMNIMVTAANRSSLEMDQMVHVGGQLYATAANLGLSFTEANAALVTYTKHGLSASEASTQLRNDIQKIVAPSKAVRDILAQLDGTIGKKIGVNLTKDFSTAGLRARGISGIFEDVRKVSDVKDKFPADLAVKVFPNLRGTVGAVIGLGTGFKDLHDDIKALNAAGLEGDAVMSKYGESIGTTNQQIQRAKNAMTLASAEVEKALSPAVVSCATVVANLAKSFSGLSDDAKHASIIAAALGGSLLVVTGITLKVASAVTALDSALVALGVGGLRAVISGSIAWAGAMALPLSLLVATVATGAYAVKRAYEIAHANEIATEAAKQVAAQNSATAQTGYNHARSVASLVMQYKAMQAQAVATHKPVEGMQQVLDQISILSPSLVSGFDAQGHAIALMGDAAAITTRKLSDMAAQSRAALMNEEKLAAARKGEELNAHKRDLLDAYKQATEPDHEGMHLTPLQRATRERLGFPIFNESNPQTRANAQARVRAEQDRIKELTAQYKQMQAHAEGFTAIPTNAGDARKRETERLYEDYDILKQRLKGAENAYIDFHRAQKGGDDTKVHKNLADAKEQLKVVATELETRRKALQTPAKTTPGANPWAGLGEKPKKEKKAKTPKKTDEDRQMEDYLRTMETIRQNEFITAHQGEDGEYAKEAEALWETQKHGAVSYNGVLKEINGTFYDIGKNEKDTFIAASKRQDTAEATRKAAEKYKDFKRDSLLDALKDPEGLNASPKTIEAYKLKNGYYKSYGKDAPAVAKTNQGLAEQVIAKQKEELIKRVEGEVEKYGQKEISVHDQVLKSLNDDKEAFRTLTAEEIEGYAKRAQALDNYAKGKQLFSDAAEKAQDDLRAVQNAQNGPQSEEARMKIELQNKAYEKMGVLGKAILIAIYRRIDAQRHLNEVTQESKDAHKLMGENLADAQDRLKNAGNPKEDAYYAYRQKIMDKYTETLKTASAEDKLMMEAEIRLSFERVYALTEEAKKAEELYNINKQVKDGLKEMTQAYAVNTDGLKITMEQWKKMTAQEKDAVKQFQKITEFKDLAQKAVQGIGDMFSKELNNIRDHGFGSFFKDVFNMFNDWLFQMAEQWAQAQITKQLTGLVNGLIGGLAGTGSAAASGGITGGDSTTGGVGDLPAVSRAATGGSIMPDAPTLVGERGPELFMPGRAGTIIPNNQLGGMGGDVNVTMNVHGATNPNEWQQTQHQVVQSLTRAIQKQQSGGRR